jgi:hypothetical protein
MKNSVKSILFVATFYGGFWHFNPPETPTFWSLCYVLAAAKNRWKCRRYLAVA